MDHDQLAQLGAVLGVVGSVLLLVARSRAFFLAGLVVLAASGLALAASDLSGSAADRVTSPPAIAAGALGAVMLVLGGLAFVRWPGAVIPAVAAAAPFRPPIDFGGSHRFLVAVATDGRIGRLIPLYAVLAAAALASAHGALVSGRVAPIPSELAYPAAFFAGLVGVSLLWTYDLPAGRNLLLFFVFPMVLLVGVVGRAVVRPWLAKALFLVTIAVAGVFAVVGLYQAYAKDDFFSTPRVDVGNVYADFFRVTSLFNDPSLYGRHLVVGIAVVVVALWARRISFAVAAVLAAGLFAALFFSYSQSSFISLAVTLIAIVLMLGDRAAKRTVVVAAALILLLGGTAVAASVQGESVGRVTSDRSRRVDVTAEVFYRHPVVGVGVGGQPAAAAEISTRNLRKADFVSHNTPLTIAAELGVLGLLAYAAVLAGSVVLFVHVRRVDEAIGAGLAAVFIALFVHSLFYGGFFEDPLAWLVLAIGSAVLIAARGTTGVAAESVEA
jgi:O-antigen ligase